MWLAYYIEPQVCVYNQSHNCYENFSQTTLSWGALQRMRNLENVASLLH